MKIRPIYQSDEQFFSSYARAEDAAECMSVSKKPLQEHIKIGKEQSIECFCFADKLDRPIAMYGLIQNEGRNFVWLLTTVFIEEHKLSFMKEVKRTVQKWYSKYGDLWLCTDMRYSKAIKLNLWAGFKRVGDVIKINGFDFGIYRFSGEK